MATTIENARKGSPNAKSNIDKETVEPVKEPMYITPVGEKSFRPRRLRKRLIIGIIIGLGAVVAIAVPLAIIMTLSKGGSSDGAQSVDIEVTILNMQYSKALADNKSLQYSNFTAQFCKEIELRYLDSQLQDEYDGCFVNDVRNGSIKVIFTMEFSPKKLLTEMVIISVLTRRTRHLASGQEQIILGKYVLEKASILVRNKNPFTASALSTASYRTRAVTLGGFSLTTESSGMTKHPTTAIYPEITSKKLSRSISTTPETQSTTAEPLPIDQQCENGATLIPYPHECQLYYNCSSKGLYDIRRRMPGNLLECPYPQLFNTETLQCDDYENVDCGTRNETKDGCGYWLVRCVSAHCTPCFVRFPSCVGQSNGSHAFMYIPWSSIFITCYKERFVSKEWCPSDSDGITMFFHMDAEECVPQYMIPQEHGGSMTNCTGKSDGSYSHDFGRCNVYGVCENGQVVEMVRCAEGKVFDEITKQCMLLEEACGSCLGKPCT